jgi:hypothetical protein
LGPSGHQYLNAVSVELRQDLSFQERGLAKPTNHKNEIYFFSLFLNLLQQLINLVFNIFKKGLEERYHHGTGNLDISSTLDLQMVILRVVFVESLDESFEFF